MWPCSGFWGSIAVSTLWLIQTRTRTGRRSKPRAVLSARANARHPRTNTTSEPDMAERQVYIYIQLPETLEVVPAALLKVTRHRDGTYVGRFRYGDLYLERNNAVELDPFQLPLGKDVYEFTKLNGIPGAVRDAAPDAWGRRVIEHRLQRDPADLEELDYLIHGPHDGAGYLSFGL